MKIFIEEQKFNQPLVLISLSIAFIVIGFSTFNNWMEISEGSMGEKLGALAGITIVSLVSLLFLKLK